MTSSGAADAVAADLAREPVVVEDLLENGQGVGRIGGLVTFVTGALPGERARIAVDEVKRTYASAHAVSIESPSPDRVEPGCSVFPRCGGCQTLHLRYAAELVWKRRMVQAALERIGGLQGVAVDEVVAPKQGDAAGSPLRYRNKVSLVCRWTAGKAQLGFYAARTHRVVAIERCPVTLPKLDAAIEGLVGFARDVPQALNGVKHVVVRASSTGPEVVIAVCGDAPNKELGRFSPELRRRIPDLTGLVNNWDPATPNAVFGRRFATLSGSPVIRERVGGTEFAFGISSFFQVNTPVLEALASTLLGALAGAGRVVDLYCGVGTFGVLLGRAGIATTGVEAQRTAVDEAAANAAANGVTNAAFETATAAVAVAGERGRTLLEGADAVIVDPPRKGCEEGVLEAIAARGIRRIIYVSCNPATLARDAKILTACGFAAKRITPFDMFAHTGHVETYAEFVRA